MSLNSLLVTVLPKFPNVREDAEIEVLQELPIQTLYLALKTADAQSLAWFYDNAAPEQIQALVDIDCWNGTEFLPARFNEAFRNIASTHPVKMLNILKALDPELIVRGLLELIHVIDFDPQNPPEVPDENLILSPDNKYGLVFENASPDDREVLLQWMNRLAMADIEFLRRQLESCKWEIKSDLEEFGHQMKKGRLEDLGFVERAEAIRLYARGNSAEFKKRLLANPLEEGTKRASLSKRIFDTEDTGGINEAFLPEVIAGPLFSEGFFADAFGKVEGVELRNLLLSEHLRTLNGVLAADEVIHEDLERIGECTRRARSYADLGLAYLADGKASEAPRMLENFPLGEIFRLGWLVVQDLSNVAREITKRYPSQLFGDKDGTLLKALDGRHPELDAAQRKELGIQASSIVSMDAVLKTGQRLTTLHAVGAYFTNELGKALRIAEHPLSVTESGYGRLLAGIFREASGVEFSTEPLTSAEWDRLAPKFSDLAGEKLLRKTALAVAERCPAPAKVHFEVRLNESVDELLNFIKARPGVRPDRRFFKALAFKEEAKS